MSLKSSERANCSWIISTVLESFWSLLPKHAFHRPSDQWRDCIFLEWTASSSMHLLWRRRTQITFFDASYSERENMSLVQQRPSPFFHVNFLVKKQQNYFLYGFALAFDRPAKSFTFNCNHVAPQKMSKSRFFWNGKRSKFWWSSSRDSETRVPGR